jgi:hypothetical protein
MKDINAYECLTNSPDYLEKIFNRSYLQSKKVTSSTPRLNYLKILKNKNCIGASGELSGAKPKKSYTDKNQISERVATTKSFQPYSKRPTTVEPCSPGEKSKNIISEMTKNWTHINEKLTPKPGSWHDLSTSGKLVPTETDYGLVSTTKMAIEQNIVNKIYQEKKEKIGFDIGKQVCMNDLLITKEAHRSNNDIQGLDYLVDRRRGIGDGGKTGGFGSYLVDKNIDFIEMDSEDEDTGTFGASIIRKKPDVIGYSNRTSPRVLSNFAPSVGSRDNVN